MRPPVCRPAADFSRPLGRCGPAPPGWALSWAVPTVVVLLGLPRLRRRKTPLRGTGPSHLTRKRALPRDPGRRCHAHISAEVRGQALNNRVPIRHEFRCETKAKSGPGLEAAAPSRRRPAEDQPFYAFARLLSALTICGVGVIRTVPVFAPQAHARVLDLFIVTGYPLSPGASGGSRPCRPG